jgi:hypothetical protein
MNNYRKAAQNQAADVTAELTSEVLCEVAIAHDRYTVAFHVTTCQMWVIDGTGRDKPRGPFLASRQAWVEALDLNAHNAQAATDPKAKPAARPVA